MFTRDMAAKVVAEFIGTATLVLVVLAIVGRNNFVFFAAVVAGLVLAIMTLVIGKISGAHLNPAVSFGLWTQRLLPTGQAVAYIVAQLLAGLGALSLYQYLVNQQISRPSTVFDWRVMVAETLGTFIFAFGVMAAVKYQLAGGALAAAVGGSLTIGILVASTGSLGVINPAVAIGIDSFARAYMVGPLLGAAVGMAAMALLYEAATPKKKSKLARIVAKVTKKRKK